MRHPHSLIVAAIVPLAVIAAMPATTSIEAIPGSGQSQIVGREGESFAARPSRRAKNTTRQNIRSRVRQIRPRTNHIDPIGEPPSGPET